MWLGDFILFLFLGIPPNSSIKRTCRRLFQALGVMKLAQNQVNPEALTLLAKEACDLLLNENFLALANNFGYALSFGRAPAQAIALDFAESVKKAKPSIPNPKRGISIKYFNPNEIPLHAVIECVLPIGKDSAVLVEMVVSENEHGKHITLEQICAT